jgi:hypothetical protein
MNAFSLVIVLVPLGAYFFLLALLFSGKHPYVVSGGRDFILLAIAMLGFVIIGPFQLFFPIAAFNSVGGMVWIALLILYAFIIVYCVLQLQPRCVIYGIHANDAQSHLHSALAEKGIEVEWLGNTFKIDAWNIQGIVEQAGYWPTAQLICLSKNRDTILAWWQMQKIFAKHLTRIPRARSYAGLSMASVGLALFMMSCSEIYFYSSEVADGLKVLFRL